MTDRSWDSKLSFVVFSDDWGAHPSSSQHIFRHIARQHNVAWINTVGMRRPTLTVSDARKAVRKISRMLAPRRSHGSSEAIGSNPVVLSPWMVPFNEFTTVRRWNRRSVARSLRPLVSQPNFEHAVVVTTVPNACDYVDIPCSSKVVYYCVDDFSEWPGLDRSMLIAMESQLIEKSDIFIATSAALFDRLASTGKPAYMLPHGVDLELFASQPDRQHPALQGIPSPRIGYFGLFDARSDQELIKAVARRMPQLSIVITGPVVTDVAELEAFHNVQFTGPVQYTDLPQIAFGLDALFLPYRVNRLTESLSPLKLKEYLATGKPVISTPIAAVKEFSDFIVVEPHADGWCAQLAQMIASKDDRRREEVRKFLQRESWSAKAEEFVQICRAE